MPHSLGENQWFQPTVRNRLTETIVLSNFDIKYGKFYNIHHPYAETKSAQGDEIPSKGQSEFGQCGRQASPTGTEGTFDIVTNDYEKIAQIYWDCPWGSSTNTISKRYVKEGYVVSVEGFSSSGALGKGTISVLAD